LEKVVKNPVPVFIGTEGTLPTQQGKVKKYLEGYCYNVDSKTAKGTIYWRCESRGRGRGQGCLGRAIEYADGSFSVKAAHNHSACHGKDQTIAFVHNAKIQATQNVSFIFFTFYPLCSCNIEPYYL
jgi:hypothetical protein